MRDNGRGIPVDKHPTEGISAATVALTVLHAGGKFDGEAYKTSGGLHGVGASVVNALSRKLELTVRRDGNVWRQTFENGGHPIAALAKGETTRDHGTTTRFWPDPEIFTETIAFDATLIANRLQKSAFLNPGLSIRFTAPDRPTETYRAETFGDIIAFLAAQPSEEGDGMGSPVSSLIETHKEIGSERGDVDVFVALQWYAKYESIIATYANNIETAWGGSHETGFRSALLRAINIYGQSANLLKEPLTAEDVREGLVAAVAVRVHEPKFEGQTKEKLANPEANGAVSTVVYQMLATYFEEHPAEAKTIIQKALAASKARLAAKKSREMVRKDAFSIGTLPGKLTDCQERDPEHTEIFLVEGDSAAGTGKGGRDPKHQAILPLRGKILNTQRAEDHRSLKSEQIENIIKALGCGTGAHFDLTKLRYGKVIIMADADVDGEHIVTLLLTFFNAHMPALIAAGKIYIAMPPLYRVQKGKTFHYIKDDADLERFFGDKERTGWTILRFKGLGEMDSSQLAETTMKPATRQLGRILYTGDRELSEATFETLMGNDVAHRAAHSSKRTHNSLRSIFRRNLVVLLNSRSRHDDRPL